MSLKHRQRRGYAMITVLVFLAVMLTILGISQRHISGLLSRERAQLNSDLFDAGPRRALATAVALLETGLPPSSPYVCATVVTTPAGRESFTVTYTEIRKRSWQVEIAPTAPRDRPPAMPPTFYDGYSG